MKTADLTRLLREPTLHFFVLAAVLLAAHRLVAGDGRTIVLTPALEADLVRRYQDQMGRAPSHAEADAYVASWKTDEALYREALREGLDREDPTVRNVLIGKVRERALMQARIPEPTPRELDEYLAHHRERFETPLTYEYEYVVFPKSQPDAQAKRAGALRQLRAGATPASLGLPSTAANVDRERIVQVLGPALADEIPRLSLGRWEELETGDRLLLLELHAVSGGLPAPDVLHAQLAAALTAERQQRAVARAVQAIVGRYRFEEKSR